jgi:hypothetical protein
MNDLFHVGYIALVMDKVIKSFEDLQLLNSLHATVKVPLAFRIFFFFVHIVSFLGRRVGL